MFEYITRAIVLKAKIDFKEEEDDRQRLWMRVLLTMLQETLTLPFHSLLPKTLKSIGDVLQKTNFLAEPLKPGKCSELFYALQLVSEYDNRDETMKHTVTDTRLTVLVRLVPRLGHHPALPTYRL